ncbi:LysM peptidoglycan-binding domain-containing protein [Bdellovibrionota bacterium FG-1]
MNKNLFLALVIVIMGALTQGCSSSPTASSEGQDPNLPPGDAATDAVPPSAEVAAADPTNPDTPPPVDGQAALPVDPPKTEAQTQPELPTDAQPAPAPAVAVAEPAPPQPVAAAQTSAPVAPVSAPDGEQFSHYTVQSGDTLMKIAFETYGDLYRWKSVLEANRDKIPNPNQIPAGTVLKVERPATSFALQKNGERYLIKAGDTLGGISGEVYGTRSKWRTLWENNRQMIHDPNRIFAGFYLYYQSENTTKPNPLAGGGALPENANNTKRDVARAPAATP